MRWRVVVCRGGATLPLGGAVAPAQKKKKSPPHHNDVHPAPSHFYSIHSQAPVCSSFNCRTLLSSNKTKHGPLIFKYPKALPNKITFYHPFSISKSGLFLLLFFLERCYVYKIFTVFLQIISG